MSRHPANPAPNVFSSCNGAVRCCNLRVPTIFNPCFEFDQGTAESIANGDSSWPRESTRATDKMSKLPADLYWTREFAHDGRDPRSWPQTKPCRGQHVLEQSYTANQHGARSSCVKCVLRLQCVPRHNARMTSVSTPSLSLLRDNDFTAKAVKTMISEVEGRKPRRRKLHHKRR